MKFNGKQLYKYRKDVPWTRFVGVTMRSDDGKEFQVKAVTMRDWPNGPLIEVTGDYSGGYNVLAFDWGTFHEVELDEELGAILVRSLGEGLLFDRVKGLKLPSQSKSLTRQNPVKNNRPTENTKRFDLILFDLDETLLHTGHLEIFRGKHNVGNTHPSYKRDLLDAVSDRLYLFTEAALQNIREAYPGIKVGIFTRAPRSYTDLLLGECYPSIRWDVVIGYDDTEGRTKPNPTGIHLAMQRLGINDPSRVLMVGDEKSDLIAAYQAGTFSALSRIGWGAQWNDKANPKRREHYWTLELHPDAVISHADDLSILISSPERFLPILESWDGFETDGVEPVSRRIDTRMHFNNTLPKGTPYSGVKAHIMGRYFPEHHTSVKYDFREKIARHKVTQQVLAAKDGADYPSSWVDACCDVIYRTSCDPFPFGDPLIVCPIPARPGRFSRMERFVRQIADKIGTSVEIEFTTDLLLFRDGVQSNKHLNQEQRFLNIREHLSVNPAYKVNEREVLVIDDVVTSGATFYYADRYLRQAGARKVTCLALTQTISAHHG